MLDIEKYLINKLLINLESEKDEGFNMGIITVLKAIVNNTILSDLEEINNLNNESTDETDEIFSEGESHYELRRKLLKTCIHKYKESPTVANEIKLDEIIDSVEEKHKLFAIKLLKESEGMGLKDAKDSIDCYCTEAKRIFSDDV